jgi:trimeric autotransporter adhesin
VVRRHLSTMSQALADSIKLQADAGDKAGAFARYVDAVSTATQGAANSLTPLHQALRDISLAWHDSSAASDDATHSMAGFFDKILSGGLEGIASLISALEKLKNGMGSLSFASLHSLDATVSQWLGFGGDNATSGWQDTTASVGAGIGASPAIISLAQRIIPVESRGQQFGPDGGVLTSSAGALGVMQVMPSNANGNDLSTLTGNITAGEQLLIKLYTKYHGDERLVAMAYNWGEGNVDKFLAGTTTVPASVQAYAQQVAGPGAAPFRARDGAPDAGGAGGLGVTNSNDATVNQALTLANGSLGAQSQQLHANIELYDKALTDLRETGQVGSDAWNKITTAVAASTLALSNLQDPFGKLTLQMNNQTQNQDILTAAYGKGYAAVAQATAGNQAETEALTTVGAKSSFYASAVDILTQKHLALAEATAKAQVAQQTLSNGDQLEYLKAETDSLGMNTDARDILLAHLKAEQDLRAKNVSELSAEGQAYLASTDAVAAQSAALQKNQQTISDLEGLATQAFDQVGSAITNAFASGGKAALNFSSLASTVLSSVASEVLKLAALNPILNSLFGGSRTTLGDVGGLLGSIGGTGGGTSGLGGIFSSVQGVLGTTLWGGYGDATTQALGALGPGVYGPATPGAVASFGGTAPATLGGLLGGVGAGFGAGTLLNSLFGGNSQNGEIGSGIGSLAGAAIGSIMPGIGTLLGGLIGGAGGGILGGLFGPPPTNSGEYSIQSFATGQQSFTGETGAKFSQANQNQAQKLSSTIYGADQAIVQALGLSNNLTGGVNAEAGSRDGLRVQSGAGLFTAADTAAGATQVINQTVQGVVSILGSKNAGAIDSTTAAILKEIDYSNSNASQLVAALGTALGGTGKLDATQTSALGHINLSSASSAIGDLDWIKNTYEPAINGATQIGTVASSIAAVNANFSTLITKAQSLGLSVDALTKAQTSQIQAVNDAATAATAQADTANIVAGLKAQAQIASYSNYLPTVQWGQQISQAADLAAFDSSAAAALTAYKAQLTGTYGQSYASTAGYAQEMVDLEHSLAEQRLAIQAQYAAAAKQQQASAEQSASGVVTNLTAYIQSLESGTGSPLNAQSQYTLAQSQFQAVLGSAEHGNVNSLNQLQSYATAFLSASQNLYGSGAQYAADFGVVVQALQAISSIPQNTLTADFMQAALQDQTTALTAAIAGLRGDVQAIQLELKQQNARAA